MFDAVFFPYLGNNQGFSLFFSEMQCFTSFQNWKYRIYFLWWSKYIPKAFGFTVLYKMTIHCMFHYNKERLRFNLVEHKKIQNACLFLTVYGNGDNDSWEERRKTGNELNWQPLIMITIGHHARRIRWPQHACARHYYMLIFFSNDQHCPLSMRRIIALHRLKVIQNQRRKTTASEAILIVQNAKKNDFDSIIRNL